MTPLVSNVTNLLSLLIIASDALAVLLFILLVTPLGRNRRGKAVLDFFGTNAIAFSLVIAIGSVASSLFYSEIAHFVPCLLCWWQRIILYPQAVILLVALIANDERVRKYCATLSAIGVVLATYHSYLQFGGNALVPCAANGITLRTRLLPDVWLRHYPNHGPHGIRLDPHLLPHPAPKRIGYTNETTIISDFVPSRRGGPQVPTPLEV